MNKLREEFEKLYKSKINTYAKFDKSKYTGEYEDYQEQVCFEIYQEQQKVIDEIKAMAESWINQDYTHNSDSTDIKIQQMKDCGRDIIRKINGELK